MATIVSAVAEQTGYPYYFNFPGALSLEQAAEAVVERQKAEGWYDEDRPLEIKSVEVTPE